MSYRSRGGMGAAPNGQPRPGLLQSRAMAQARQQMEYAPGTEEVRKAGGSEQRRRIRKSLEPGFWNRYKWGIIGGVAATAAIGVGTFLYVRRRRGA